MRSKLESAVLGFCAGDALGVPAEFKPRETLDLDPVTEMAGYGTHHQPPGTWSDDSSLMFCLMESLIIQEKIDLYDLADRFGNWLEHGDWTPHGVVFDVGIATRKAIQNYREEAVPPELAGGAGEFSNGNGSLMRILPLAFFLRNKELESRIEGVAQVSSVTHRHPVSIIACLLYTEIAIRLLDGDPLPDSISKAVETIGGMNLHNEDLQPFSRILNGEISKLKREEIQSSGYVVHTLEASLWCLLTSGSFDEAVLKAVNLGEDTDTTGAVTGGLAGLIYGLDRVPEDWVTALARLDDIKALCTRFNRLISTS
ncbi:ADP-ribosylglycohydrolase family protein [Paenibacillus physcomitrellae]|uniref:ADP-ribosylglycohydrolase n=1 Tax=Paenibacillus physcomitrellae TaxID=1619311 RepID=A0ABQ1FPT8_9BACL|nr:ADP-ribosylglycohydrolase family protein [Paenibacillus physcomitrellae]GGA24255.1 hypothetical protein GCM10010917_06360 [Paenibacillus physcomitrellae]